MLVTMVVPTGKVLPLAGTLTTLTEPQLSVAPTTKVTLLLLHWPASPPGPGWSGRQSTGFSLSVTVTVKVQTLLLP